MEERIEPKVGVVVVAGGSGTRLGGSTPKQFQILGQRPLLAHTIDAFAKALPKAEIVVVLAADRVEYWKNLSSRFEVSKHRVVAGGAERYDSVKCGIEAISNDVDLIAVHDGARPFVSKKLINRCVNSAISSGSAVPVVAVSDSLREMTQNGASRAIDRSVMRAVQTPQIFEATLLQRAYKQPYKISFTDDASLVEALGERVWLCEGESENIKITTKSDMLLAQYIFESKDDECK